METFPHVAARVNKRRGTAKAKTTMVIGDSVRPAWRSTLMKVPPRDFTRPQHVEDFFAWFPKLREEIDAQGIAVGYERVVCPSNLTYYTAIVAFHDRSEPLSLIRSRWIDTLSVMQMPFGLRALTGRRMKVVDTRTPRPWRPKLDALFPYRIKVCKDFDVDALDEQAHGPYCYEPTMTNGDVPGGNVASGSWPRAGFFVTKIAMAFHDHRDAVLARLLETV